MTPVRYTDAAQQALRDAIDVDDYGFVEKMLTDIGVESGPHALIGYTPLMVAVSLGHDKCVEYLLTRDPDKQVLAETKRGCIALMMVSDATCAALLLRHQPDAQLEKRNVNLMTPMIFACARGHHECVSLFLDRDALLDGIIRSESGDEFHAFTAIHYATSNGHHKCIEFLLERSWRPDELVMQSDKFGYLPIHYAATHGRIECLELLLRHCPQQQINYDNGVMDPLGCALTSQSQDTSAVEQCIRLLLCRGATTTRMPTEKTRVSRFMKVIRDIVDEFMIPIRLNEAVVGLALSVKT